MAAATNSETTGSSLSSSITRINNGGKRRRPWHVVLSVGTLVCTMATLSTGGRFAETWNALTSSVQTDSNLNGAITGWEENNLTAALVRELKQKEIELKRQKALRLSNTVRQNPRNETNIESTPRKRKPQQGLIMKEDRGKAQPRRDDFVSGCLYIMDDNHALIEWLAYHYHTLSLRNLIVLPDKKSKTTPIPILNRWKGLINFTIWDDTNIFPNGKNPITSKKQLHLQHVIRQGRFTSECFRALLDEGRRWVINADPDEYIHVNDRVTAVKDNMYKLGLGNNRDAPVVISPRNPGSTLNFVEQSVAYVHKYGIQNNKYLKSFETPCITITRRQFGTYGDAVDAPFPSALEEHGILPTDLKSWSYQYWGRDKDSPAIIGKAMLDLHRLNKDDFEDALNIHSPVKGRDICRAGDAWRTEKRVALVMNHYPSTEEQAFFRTGDNRSKNATAYMIERQEKEKRYKTFHEPHSHIRDWTRGFVEIMGEKEALRLLKDAGNPKTANMGAYLSQ